MTQNSEFHVRGERARLFPVLADTSKEGRSLSIFLACLESVEELSRALLSETGIRVGNRSQISAYTEVVLKKGGEKSHRPDGLIVVRNGSRVWTALVEAKIGNSELTPEQLEAYLELAKLNGVNSVITISNQFAALPTHHPVTLPSSVRRKADLFHWSWMYILTQANLLLSNNDIQDREQALLIHELDRFLSHSSTGVRSFDQMPAAWSEVVGTIQAGGRISANSEESREVIGAWHQEVRDLTLVLSRQLGRTVETRISRAHAADPATRVKAATTELADTHRLSTTIIVPDAAAPLDVCADLAKRSLSSSMKLKAPGDKKSTKARVNWLLRQLQDADGTNIHVRLFWPGRTPFTQHPISTLREDPETASAGREDQAVLSFEVLSIKDLGGRFAQRRNFIAELEAAVPNFYEQVGQHLKAWQAPAPRLREAKVDPSSVDVEAIQSEVERQAHERGHEVPYGEAS